MIYCRCEVPNINPVSDKCEVCTLPANPEWFVWHGITRYYEPPPLTLGIKVSEQIETEEKN